MARQFFSGNSIEQAVLSAARHYEIEPERVAYKVREKKHGFVNQRRRVVIEVNPESPQAPESEKTSPEGDSSTAGREVLSGPAVRANRGKPAPRIVPPQEAVSLDDQAEQEPAEVDTHGPGPAVASDEAGEKGKEESARRAPRGGRQRDSSGRQQEEKTDRGRSTGGREGSGRESRGRDSRSRGGHGRSDRRRDVKVVEHYWEDVEWDENEIEEGLSREMAAFELAIEKVLDVMDLDIEYSITEGESFEIDFSGEDEEILTEDDGKVLKALEHILPRVVRNLIGKTVPCRADCDGFQADREEDLRRQAHEAANDVAESGRSRLLSPMTPADRRIVHLALVDNEDVDTSSEGNGFLKRVRVMSAGEDDE